MASPVYTFWAWKALGSLRSLKCLDRVGQLPIASIRSNSVVVWPNLTFEENQILTCSLLFLILWFFIGKVQTWDSSKIRLSPRPATITELWSMSCWDSLCEKYPMHSKLMGTQQVYWSENFQLNPPLGCFAAYWISAINHHHARYPTLKASL